jgi:hypothetical protein
MPGIVLPLGEGNAPAQGPRVLGRTLADIMTRIRICLKHIPARTLLPDCDLRREMRLSNPSDCIPVQT